VFILGIQSLGIKFPTKMIKTYWTTKAFNTYAKVFQRWGKVVIMWDIRSQKLVFTRNMYQLFPHLIQLFGVVGVTIVQSFYVGIYSLLFYYGTPTNDPEPVKITYPPKALAVLYIF